MRDATLTATSSTGPVRSETHRAVAQDGVEVALRRFTSDSSGGVPVVMTHGAFSNGSICWRLAAYLAAHGFDCWVLELRG